jgi:Ca-activated chloride channel family protein
LLRSAFALLVDKLDENDTVSIVTYAGNAGTVLEPTSAREKAKILAAIDGLRPGGSTAGAAGIQQAYALARSSYLGNGVNRVILATDGDFNVGISNVGQLKDYIAKQRKSGIFLSVLGFGQGNYNDRLMQVLAQNGNGNAAYIDSLREARKVLVEEAGSTLHTIAKDVKIQIEFNPAVISEYRLIGYETRALSRADFNNDKVDAGDIGAGHTVTALYEITPVGSGAQLIDDLRYGVKVTAPDSGKPGEIAFLKMRYKLPSEDTSHLIERPITQADVVQRFDSLNADIRFAAAVAAFGQKLRASDLIGDFSFDQILAIANGAKGRDAFGYRAEFTGLVRLADSLTR